ncbi:hypothetical protein LQK80_24580 [Bacillus thuringiensis]|nr:hypothetical protein [Bacillus thuringiensis]
MATVFGVTKSDIDTTYKNSKVEIVDGELQLVQEKPTDNESKRKSLLLVKSQLAFHWKLYKI